MEFGASSEDIGAHLPRASVAVGSDQGGRARRRQARAQLLTRIARPFMTRRRLVNGRQCRRASCRASRAATARSSTTSSRCSPSARSCSTTRSSPRSTRLQRLARRAGGSSAPRGDRRCARWFAAAGAAARHLPLRRRRARQELPDGRLLRDRAAAAQDARAFPCLHARACTRAARRSKDEDDPLARSPRPASRGASASSASTNSTSSDVADAMILGRLLARAVRRAAWCSS